MHNITKSMTKANTMVLVNLLIEAGYEVNGTANGFISSVDRPFAGSPVNVFTAVVDGDGYTVTYNSELFESENNVI